MRNALVIFFLILQIACAPRRHFEYQGKRYRINGFGALEKKNQKNIKAIEISDVQVPDDVFELERLIYLKLSRNDLLSLPASV